MATEKKKEDYFISFLEYLTAKKTIEALYERQKDNVLSDQDYDALVSIRKRVVSYQRCVSDENKEKDFNEVNRKLFYL